MIDCLASKSLLVRCILEFPLALGNRSTIPFDNDMLRKNHDRNQAAEYGNDRIANGILCLSSYLDQFFLRDNFLWLCCPNRKQSSENVVILILSGKFNRLVLR